jgi:hypothetical protein
MFCPAGRWRPVRTFKVEKRFAMKIHGWSAGLAWLVLAGRLAQAATYYVSPDGQDANTGTEGKPFHTIQKAADLARAGDTVIVRGGVYNEHVILRHSGAPEEPIIFKNAPGERPIVDTDGKGRIELQSEEGWQKPIGWISIEGFEIRNGWDGIKFYNAHDIVIRGNQIHDNANQGILGNGHQVRIEGNVIWKNGFKPDNQDSNLEHGIYGTGTDFIIVNNIIHSNKAYGIQIAGYAYDAEKHAGPEFAGARHWLVSHNTIAFQQNRAAIVVWQDDATDCVIQNNILYQNALSLGEGSCQGVEFISGGGHMVRNNVLYGPERSMLGESQGEYTTSENVTSDPLFVDAENYDFRLRRRSPAVDAGTPHQPLPTDFDGATRPQGAGHDIGAFELQD